MDEDFRSFKRYRLLITLVFILLALGLGFWLVNKRGVNKTEVRKDEVLHQLNQLKK